MSDKSRENEQQEKERLLGYMSKRAGSDNFFLASALESYRKSEKLSEKQLAEYLEIAPSQLNLLGLCRRPDVNDQARFSRDVKTIGEKFGITLFKLAALVRRATAFEANQLAETNASSNYLMAALDREPEAGDESQQDEHRND